MYCSSNFLKLFLLTIAFALFHILPGAETAFAQKSATEIYFETLAQAEAKTQAKQWAEAAALWEKVVAANPVEGNFLNQLGSARYNAKDYCKSIAAYEKALELGAGNPANAAYNIACNYALLGEKELGSRI